MGWRSRYLHSVCLLDAGSGNGRAFVEAADMANDVTFDHGKGNELTCQDVAVFSSPTPSSYSDAVETPFSPTPQREFAKGGANRTTRCASRSRGGGTCVRDEGIRRRYTYLTASPTAKGFASGEGETRGLGMSREARGV